MSDDPRLEPLLDKLLDSQATPEQACASCPELLPEVRRRWQEIKRVRAELDVLFPPSTWSHEHRPTYPLEETPLPTLPGYEVKKVLGRGGVGVVYEAVHLLLNRPVAVKMLLSGEYASPDELERFLREAEAVAGLHHPNIVNLYDVGEVEGKPYFTMEFVEGGSLARKLAKGPMPAREATALVAQVTEAIEEAHQSGIIHRDLKPGNILLTTAGTPKVTDFGLARLGRDGGLTLSGVPVGTPSYMAPCQARGEKSAIGPATDVYGLGAILYECLTGQPPFRADTSTATLQQVLIEEPPRPAQLNPRVPRDLETICLKCLEKDLQRRYVSAAALADDLHRFERGEPISARPIGHVARALRWARRRPALAAALAAGMLVAAALVVTVLWWHGERMRLQASAVAHAEADLSRLERMWNRGEFEASADVLKAVRQRLGEYVPPELAERLSTAFDNQELVTRLNAIQLERALVKPPTGLLDAFAVPMAERDNKQLRIETLSCQHYEEAFRKAGIGGPADDPMAAAARVQSSPVRAALVSALDEWSACAADRVERVWILAVVRQADPDPWRDRVRDPATWDNSDTLRDLADRAPVAEQSPYLLVVLGARLRAKNLDTNAYMARVVSACPADFWVNVEMANTLYHQSNSLEAIGFYRAALALRPRTLALRYALGDLYLNLKRWDEAIAEYEQAVALDPENAWCQNRLGFALAWRGGRDDEAIAHTRKAVRIDANEGWYHYCLGFALDRADRFDEAVAELNEAMRLLPEKRAEWRRDLRYALLRRGRAAEARDAWKEDLVAHPAAPDEWSGYAELCLYLGDETEHSRARRELLKKFGTVTDPAVAERVARACLLLPAPEDELQQAVALTKSAMTGGRVGNERGNPYFRFTEGLAQYRQNRFDEAIELMNGEAASVLGPSSRLVLAMAQYQNQQKDEARKTLAAAITSYDWDTAKAITPDAWLIHILRREADALILRDKPPRLVGK